MALFAEVGGTRMYSINVYRGQNIEPSFQSINNLFHPSTIDGCFIHDGYGSVGGIKIQSGESEDDFVWNTKPHKERIVRFTPKELKVLATTFESSDDWEVTKLVSVHAESIMSILQKLSTFKQTVADVERKGTLCWHETNAQYDGTTNRETKYPDYEKFELIYSGPHFYVANPIYKTPREICTEKGHYDIVDIAQTDSNYFARTNYVPATDLISFQEGQKGFLIGYTDTFSGQQAKPIYDEWFSYFKVCFSGMLSIAGERTLQPAIIPPKVSHIHGVFSVIFKKESDMVEFAGLSASTLMDFYIKTVGSGNLSESRLAAFPLGVSEPYRMALAVRTLRLNCLNTYYTPLWERQFSPAFPVQEWAVEDVRLSPFASLTPVWEWATPLRGPATFNWTLS